MEKIPLILIGSGGHAKSCIDVIEETGRYKLLGYIDKKKNKKFKLNYLGEDKELKKINKICKNAIIGVGQIKDYKKRSKIFNYLKKLKFSLPAIKSPFSHVSKKSFVQEGSIVMHGAIINSGAKIGKNCIINTKALIEHDVTVKDHCHISTGAIINGDAEIGEYSFIGSGSVIKNGLKLNKKSFIGMGSKVKK